MNDEFLILNIREYLKQGQDGEDLLRQSFSAFSCRKNIDVEKFLQEQSVDFTKKNQSVTYIVLNPEEGRIVGYFTLTIKPISVNGEKFSNTVKRKLSRVSEQDMDNGNYQLSAYLIAQLGKNFHDGLNEKITGQQLLGLAVEKIKELQYVAGGMVVFLETQNEEKLLHFYERQNGFKRFDTREVKHSAEEPRCLIQLLKVL